MKYQPKGRPRGSSSDDGTDLSTKIFLFSFLAFVGLNNCSTCLWTCLSRFWENEGKDTIVAMSLQLT